jgi:Zn-dependent protease
MSSTLSLPSASLRTRTTARPAGLWYSVLLAAVLLGLPARLEAATQTSSSRQTTQRWSAAVTRSQQLVRTAAAAVRGKVRFAPVAGLRSKVARLGGSTIQRGNRKAGHSSWRKLYRRIIANKQIASAATSSAKHPSSSRPAVMGRRLKAASGGFLAGLGNTTWRVGRLFGIPVSVNWTLPLMFTVIALALPAQLPLYLVSFGSVFAHEFGHALTARGLGGDVEGVTMHALGGLATISGPSSPGAFSLVLAAGPAVNFALTGGLLALNAFVPNPILVAGAAVNLLLGGFNLLPITPLDGGQLLLHGVAAAHDDEEKGYGRGIRLANTVGWAGVGGLSVMALTGAPSMGIWAALLGLMHYQYQAEVSSAYDAAVSGSAASP